MSRSRRRQRDEADDVAIDDAAAGLAALHGATPAEAEEPPRKLLTPGPFISFIRERYEPLFGKEHNHGATQRGFLKLLEKIDGDSEDKVAALEQQIAELREERDLLKLRSVESTVLRNANFEAEFGIDKETFDWVLSFVEKDLPGSSNVEDPPIFSPEGEVTGCLVRRKTICERRCCEMELTLTEQCVRPRTQVSLPQRNGCAA
jgi:hypothetical protein